MIETGTLLQERFLVEEQIGIGGMGAVYRATDQKFGTTVAIKETLYTDAELAHAFEREARLLNGLHHPIFPHVSDFFREGNGHFLVMEYIHGEDMSELLQRGEPFQVDTVIRWTMDLLDGLDYLHSQQPPVIHRDIKPNNLKLTERGNVVLLDFGMAKEASGHTQGMRSVFGYSRRYSPLEQIEGTGTDERADIFSLGATVYHLLTGQPPVDVLARVSAMVAGRPDPLVSARDVNGEVPDRFSALLTAALALSAEQRFASAAAMRNALEGTLQPETIAGEAIVHTAAPAASPSEARTNANPLVIPTTQPEEPVSSRDVTNRLTSVRIRRPRRSALFWLPVAAAAAFVILLLLFASGLNKADENVTASEATAVESVDLNKEMLLSEDVSATNRAEANTELAERGPPDDAELANDLNSDADDKRVEISSRASVPVEVRVPDHVGGEPAERPATRQRSGESTRHRDNQPSSSRQRIANERREEPPVSSIETVLSGVPRRPQRWEVVTDDEIQRMRRFRRMIENRRSGPDR